MKKTLILASIASLLAAPAFAAEPGFYAGANIGASQQDINGAGTKTENPTTWGLYGGYNFDRHFGIEAGYQNFGKAKIEGQSELKSYALSADLVARYPLAKSFDVYGKAGLAFVDRKLEFASGGDYSHSGTVAKLALGGEYQATRNIGLRTEVTQYLGAPEITGVGYEYKKDNTTFTLGANYHF